MSWRLALVGVVAGLTSGVFGVGGGVVIVPLLIALAGFDQRLAHGTSLTAILPISAAGSIGYAAAGEVAWGPAAAIALGAVAGAVIGSHLLARLPLGQLRLAFAILLVVSAIRLLIAVPEGSGVPPFEVLSAAAYVGLGLFSGVLAGTMGVGGGIVMVPALSIFGGFGLVLAKGTSLAVIIPTALAATLRNHRSGTTRVGPGLVVGVAGTIFGYLGARLALVINATWAAALFAALLIVAAVRLGREVFAERGRDAIGTKP